MSQTIPHNAEAEEAVIGSVLINPAVYIELAQFLAADDFYIHRNRWIWSAFVRLQEKKMPLDYLTVCTELEEMKMLGEVGGDSYLAKLIGQSPNSTNAVAYGHTVEAMGVRRRLLTAANGIATEVYDTTRPIEETIANCAAKLQVATAVGHLRRKTLAQLIDEHRNAVAEKGKETDAHVGIMTYLPDVDKILGFGLQKKFMILAGRPGKGKTSLAVQIALQAVKQGKTVAIFSLEMDAPQVVNVVMSILTGIDSQRLAAGRLTPEEWETYNSSAETLLTYKNNMIIDCNPIASVQTMRAKCLAIKSSGSLDLVIIDYLMRIKGYGSLDANDKANNLTADIASLKGELDTAIILIHHMNRAIEHRGDGEPILSDLNEGGERDPDIVAFLHSTKDVIQVGPLIPMRLSFSKHRGGPTGSVDLLFKGECTTFLPAATRYLSLKGAV